MVIVEIADRHTHAEGQNDQQEGRNRHPLILAPVQQSDPPLLRPVQQTRAIRPFPLWCTIIVFELMGEVKHKREQSAPIKTFRGVTPALSVRLSNSSSPA